MEFYIRVYGDLNLKRLVAGQLVSFGYVDSYGNSTHNAIPWEYLIIMGDDITGCDSMDLAKKGYTINELFDGTVPKYEAAPELTAEEKLVMGAEMFSEFYKEIQSIFNGAKK